MHQPTPKKPPDIDHRAKRTHQLEIKGQGQLSSSMDEKLLPRFPAQEEVRVFQNRKTRMRALRQKNAKEANDNCGLITNFSNGGDTAGAEATALIVLPEAPTRLWPQHAVGLWMIFNC